MSDVPDGWADQLRANRTEKDRFFAEHRQSPIPPGERDSFDGLAYYEPDPSYYVTATVEVHEEPQTLELETTNGPAVTYERVATLSFTVDGSDCSLAGYRQPDGDATSLFVPFRDKTTGQQTYENGRYLELELESPLDDGQEIPLDFNLAYAPFCAYSETFACPLPPEENWLDVTLEAGERNR
jgi:hypothetical protein